MVVDEGGLARKYPIRTKEHVRWEIEGNHEVHLGGVRTAHGGDLDFERGNLTTRLTEDTGEI